MNDRARAISVLQQARDILAERLTERILESRDEILEDALGLSFAGEIDVIQDQLGQRLNNVNLLLNNLPPVEEAPPPQEEDMTPAAPPALGYEAPSSFGEATAVSIFTDALQTVVVDAAPVAASRNEPPAVSLQAFVEHVLTNDLETAALVLGTLLEISPVRGRECAQRFQEQLAERPQFLQKAMNLRQELTSGSINGALLLLWECFGLQGMESIAALQSLKSRLSVAVTPAQESGT